MIIDVITLVAVAFGLFKGFSKGLIVALFSFLAYLIGLAAAVKLSAVVAVYLGTATGITQKWLPILSFALVFIGVVLLVRLGAALVEKTAKLVLLGWVNKLGGILLFVLLYCTLLSVLLFYASQLSLLSQSAMAESVIWPYLQPLGPAAINLLGILVPAFSNLFEQLH
ncbi:MAG: CvpA family protein [Bacteroidetes bacterium]|nr:MAG: CvpA family protein [Bacteroidota bacterium]